MKILVVTPSYFPKIGGIASVVRELTTRTALKGVQITIAHVSHGHTAFSVDEVDGIKVYRLPMLGHRLAGYVRGLGRLAAEHDLLHVHDPQVMMISANVVLQCRGIPAVLSTHGGFHHTNQHRFVKWLHEHSLMRSLLRRYWKILATSETDFTYFRQFSDRVEKGENGIAFTKFQSGRLTTAPNPKRWICWGRWSRNKRIDSVIDTVALARDHGIAIDLLIAGPDFDNLGTSLRSKIEELQLQSSVHMHAYIEDDVLLKQLQQRTVYITGSEYEGFGVGILEAMAAGKIVVCRDIKPLNGFVDQYTNGFFMKFDSGSKDLTTLRQIVELSDDSIAAMSSSAQHKAKQYDWEVVAENFMKHYTSALEGLKN